jgi:hypothetical protein
MLTRLFAKCEQTPLSSRVKHYVGLPPELTDGKDKRAQLGSPAFLLIEERADGILLFRHDASGGCVGDTWHQSLQDAKDQATFEYSGVKFDWCDVPASVKDAVEFGVAQLD